MASRRSREAPGIDESQAVESPEEMNARLAPLKAAAFDGSIAGFSEHRDENIAKMVEARGRVRGVTRADANAMSEQDQSAHYASLRASRVRGEVVLTPRDACMIAANYLHDQVAQGMGYKRNPDRSEEALPYIEDPDMDQSKIVARDGVIRKADVSNVQRASFSDKIPSNLRGASSTAESVGVRTEFELRVPMEFVAERYPDKFKEMNERLTKAGAPAIVVSGQEGYTQDSVDNPTTMVIGARAFIKSPKYRNEGIGFDENVGLDTVVPGDPRTARAIQRVSTKEAIDAVTAEDGLLSGIKVQSPRLREAMGVPRRGALEEGVELPTLREAYERFREGAADHDPAMHELVQKEARGALLADLAGLETNGELNLDAAEAGKRFAGAAGIITDLERHEIKTGEKRAHLFVRRTTPRGNSDVNAEGKPSGYGSGDLGMVEPGMVRSTSRGRMPLELAKARVASRQAHLENYKHETTRGD